MDVTAPVPLSLLLFTGLLVAIGVVRLLELRISHAHRRALAAQGAPPVPEPHFRAMVVFHTGILIAAGAEAWLLHRPWLPGLTFAALAAVVGATALRAWVIATLGTHWNVQIVDSTRLGVVTSGPFRFVRHPNYVAVFVELVALPLVHGAWISALCGIPIHMWVLSHRIRAEEAVLLADPAYRAAMGGKPRFVPRLRGGA
jgi:methyltransferase